MAKTFKPRFVLLAILFFMLLLSTLHSFMPAAYASEPTIMEKGVSILSNVAGIDMAKYNVTSKEGPPYQYFDVFSEDNMRYTLESHSSKIDVLCTFAKGKLHTLNVLETEGSPSMTEQASSIAVMAKSFLNDYAGFSGSSLYSDLGLMLNGAEAGKNSTATLGNVKLQVSGAADNVTFSWIYTFNGVDAAEKCVALGYKNGFLKYFVDTWGLYNVGSTTVNLSKDEAVAIAMQSIKTFSYKVGSGNETVEVKDFKVTRAMVTQLDFCSSIGSGKVRGDDALILYPMWRIGIGLDKFYPGNVYGIYVDIWADTKEVKQVQEVFSTLPPELVGLGLFDENAVGTLDSQESRSELQSNFAPSFWVALAVVSVVFGAVPFWLRLKKGSLRFHNFPVLRSFRITGGLLCFLLFSVSLLAPISLVTAYSGRATIWGEQTYLKTDDETHYQDLVAANVTLFFDDAGGYNVTNYQKDRATVKSTILAQIGYSEQNYSGAAVVYFDHGMYENVAGDYNNLHYFVHDDYGDPVYDMDIYNATQGKTFFAFISTCVSANMTFGQGHYGSGNAFGMPYAFTHNLVGIDMSSDGYDNPWGDSCYIGFPWGSAALSQTVDDDFSDHLYWMWVYSFFWFALYNDISINSALDEASLMLFESDFGGTKLHNNFTAIWGNMTQYPNCNMTVYGNGNMQLYQPLLTVNATDSGSNPVSATVYIDDEYAGTAGNSFRVLRGWHTVRVESTTNIFHNFAGYAEFENPIAVLINHDKTVTANYYAIPPPEYELSISAGEGGTTDPEPDDHLYTPQLVTVTADPDNGYFFDYWLLDDVPHYLPCYEEVPYITIPMSSNHTLQAYFTPEPSYQWVSSIYGYGGYTYFSGWLVDNPEKLVGWRNDSEFTYLTGLGLAEEYGWINATMNTEAAGHIYLYGYADYGEGNIYVYVSSDGEEWDFVGCEEVTQDSPYWIDFGLCLSPFNYVLLTTEDPEPVYTIAVDSVRVEPPAYYNLTISSSSGGSTNPPAGTYEDILEGTPVAVTANPDSGYDLDEWLLDSQPEDPNQTIYVTMDGNHVLQAVFEEITHYNLTLICGEDGYTDPEADVYEDILKGTFFNVTAYPDTGYAVCWMLDSELYSANHSVTVQMNSNHVLEAVFVDEGLLDGFGNTEIFEEQRVVCSNWECWVLGQIFSCPDDGFAVSMTAAVSSYCTGGGMYVRYAIYRFDDFGLVAQTEYAEVEAQGESPDWQTLAFTAPPLLEDGEDYVLVVAASGDPYGVLVAYDYAEDIDGVEQELDEYYDWDLDLPVELLDPSGTYEEYSIFCTVLPV